MSEKINPDRSPVFTYLADDGRVCLESKTAQTYLTPHEARSVASALIELAAVGDGNAASLAEWKRWPMQYLRLRIETHPDGGEPAAGFAHCWVKDQSRRNALYVAEGFLADDGWVVRDVLEHRAVEGRASEPPRLRRYYEQALIDDEVFYLEPS